MDEVLKSQMILDDLAKAIAEEREEDALEYYMQYKTIYEKITGKELRITFEELKKTKNKEKEEQEIEMEL